jgi:hypothetical protein
VTDGTSPGDIGDSEDADGSACGDDAGTIAVVLAVCTTGGCECVWSMTGPDPAANSSGQSTGYEFSETCLPSGSYDMSCTCGNDPFDQDAFGPCEGGTSFVVTPGTTTHVLVSLACPG